MENAVDRRWAADPRERADHVELDEVVEFATFIRERPVTCHWADGEVTGDPELLERLSRMSVPDGWTSQPASVAKAISDAVAHPVAIRIVHRHEIELPGYGSASPCDGGRDDADVLGDYWLG